MSTWISNESNTRNGSPSSQNPPDQTDLEASQSYFFRLNAGVEPGGTPCSRSARPGSPGKREASFPDRQPNEVSVGKRFVPCGGVGVDGTRAVHPVLKSVNEASESSCPCVYIQHQRTGLGPGGKRFGDTNCWGRLKSRDCTVLKGSHNQLDPHPRLHARYDSTR